MSEYINTLIEKAKQRKKVSTNVSTNQKQSSTTDNLVENSTKNNLNNDKKTSTNVSTNRNEIKKLSFVLLEDEKMLYFISENNGRYYWYARNKITNKVYYIGAIGSGALKNYSEKVYYKYQHFILQTLE